MSDEIGRRNDDEDEARPRRRELQRPRDSQDEERVVYLFAISQLIWWIMRVTRSSLSQLIRSGRSMGVW